MEDVLMVSFSIDDVYDDVEDDDDDYDNDDHQVYYAEDEDENENDDENEDEDDDDVACKLTIHLILNPGCCGRQQYQGWPTINRMIRSYFY
jgi:hypothetical protein